MNVCIPAVVCALLMAACGGAATKAAVDSGEDALTCQEVALIPDAALYTCEAGPPGSMGCRAAGLDPNAASDPNVYPAGCTVTLPLASTFCGPVGCTCQRTPGPSDGGLQFVCPL